MKSICVCNTHTGISWHLIIISAFIICNTLKMSYMFTSSALHEFSTQLTDGGSPAGLKNSKNPN